MKSVRRVARVKPAKTTMPSGWRNSEPSPMPSARGNSPKTVVTVVIRIGRRRWGAAVRMALSRSIPAAVRIWLAVSTMMMALLTTIPTRRTAPTTTVIPIAVWVIYKPKIPPTRARGMVRIITKGSIIELYWTAITTKTKKAAKPPRETNAPWSSWLVCPA